MEPSEFIVNKKEKTAEDLALDQYISMSYRGKIGPKIIQVDMPTHMKIKREAIKARLPINRFIIKLIDDYIAKIN